MLNFEKFKKLGTKIRSTVPFRIMDHKPKQSKSDDDDDNDNDYDDDNDNDNDYKLL